MSTIETTDLVPGRSLYTVQWGPVIAGAICAAALSSVLLGFAGAAGISVVSTAPTWRDASFALWLLAGLLVLIIAMASFGAGGYVAGRLRSRTLVTAVEEVEISDGVHGLLSWGIAVLLGGLVALATAQLVTPVAPAGATTSVAGENLLAFELDRLFRAPHVSSDIVYRRAEAGRILLTTSGHNGITNEDRDYLTEMVAAETRVPLDIAAVRVDQAASRAHDALLRARTAAVLAAFMSATALLLGAACAWYAACAGGRDRERGVIPRWWATHRRFALNA